MQMLSRRLGGDLAKNRMLMVDPYFSKLIKSSYGSFLEEEDKLHFNWGRNIISYVTGKSRGRTNKLEFGRDVDMVYAPMMWGPDHWVGLCINLEVSHVTILDSYPTLHPTEEQIEEQMAPVLESLPYILEQYTCFTKYLSNSLKPRYYSCSRLEGIYVNARTGDCGPCAAKFMEIHANGGRKEEMSKIDDRIVERFREQYAMDCYEEFLGPANVVNQVWKEQEFGVVCVSVWII